MIMREERNILRQKSYHFGRKNGFTDRKKETAWLMQEESEDKKECGKRKKRKKLKNDSGELEDV